MSLLITVPATTANLGPGFDCLGMALDLVNDFKIAPLDKGPSRVSGTGACAGLTGTDNPFFDAFRRVCRRAGVKPPAISVEVAGRVPMARGLGSSATAIVAGAMAANALAGSPFGDADLLLEMSREEGHPDNVTPAFLGGLTASVMLRDRVAVKRVAPEGRWRLAVLIPSYPLSTEKARAAIPKTIPLADAVFNLTRVPVLLDCLERGETGALAQLLEDRLHQPYRKKLIKKYDAIIAAAIGAGAAGAFLSGAGPTMAAFVQGQAAAVRVAEAMAAVAREAGFEAEGLALKPRLAGATIKTIAKSKNG